MSEFVLDRAAITIAVDWWVNAIRGGAKQDNGDAMQSMLTAFVAAEIGPPTEYQIDVFRTKLNTFLVGLLLSPSTPRFHDRLLSVDYQPEGTLLAAANHANLSALHFPVKTVMWLKNDSIRVRHGYGASIQTLWGKELEQE
jgi:hypothetical protein